ncbi:MAG: heme NO-binding domain-containing protein [Candidatus Hermodarchaeota archaeon]
MKGVIIQCTKDLVSKLAGYEKWEEILEKSGLPKDLRLLPNSDIDDSQFMHVVSIIMKEMNLDIEQLADAFGDYWVNVFSQKLYHSFYRRRNRAKDFLLKMDWVHQVMTQNMERSRPPRFEYLEPSENELIMVYSSPRNLIDFVVGLAKGVGKFYNEKLEVKKLGNDKVHITFF